MNNELVEKALVAASIAASKGYVNTSMAIIEFARDLEKSIDEAPIQAGLRASFQENKMSSGQKSI